MKKENLLRAKIKDLEEELALKNRELEIEAALEKVRSRSLAMHRSDELQEIITSVLYRLSELGLSMDTAVVVLPSEEKQELMCWVATNDFSYSQGFRIPFGLNSVIRKDSERFHLSGSDYFAKTYSKEEKDEYYKNLIKHSDFKHIPQDRKDFLFSTDNYGISIASNKNSGIQTISYSGKILNETEAEVLKRFSRVFEQAYVRFLDLQKAEAQAKEAQIETALERVRSKTMAMHKSEDLLDVIQTVYDQLVHFNFKIDNIGFITDPYQSDDYNIWSADPNGVLPNKLHIRYFDHPINWDYIEHKNSGQELTSKIYSFEEKNTYWKGVFKNMSGVPEEIKEILLNVRLASPALTVSRVLTKNIILYLFKFDGTIYSDEENAIFIRFSRVFQQTYTRFLDLQKAEAQARESQIQLALERVRARTMAMQHSEELTDTAALLFQQVNELGIQQWGNAFQLWDDDMKGVTSWTCTHGVESLKSKIPATEDPVMINIVKAAQKGEYLYVEEMGGEALEDHYKFLTSLPVLKEVSEKLVVQGFTPPKFQIFHAAYFSYGYILFITHEAFPEAHDIFKRFAAVFEQTYTRFLDLQKAEAQAQEAIKRASVDRVRAEIASMRTKGDLERIQPLIWNELKILRVPFIRCGVFIMDEVKQDVQVFLSTPDGKSIAAFRLPYYATEQSMQIVTHWQKKHLYKDHMDEAAFSAYTKNMVQQGAMAGNEKYVTENRPTDLYLHFLPFLQGMLYVGNDAPLKEEELQLVQNLADAFSTAYARYEDFNKLELAKAEVESAMTELKATQSQLVQQEKLASLGQLTAGIAHEIKNPLNFVNNFSEVSMELIEEALEEIAQIEDNEHATESAEILSDVKSNLKKIHEHGPRANGIVTSMLQHSRGGSGKKEPTDLNALIKEYVNLSFHGMRAGKNPINVDIVLDLDPGIKEVSLIKEDFTRVIINLCNNAFDAMRMKTLQGVETLGRLAAYQPILTVRTKAEDGKVQIEIIDNGPGIPDEIKEKILQPFFTTKKGTEGTGLGLSITHDIVKAHGGKLNINSQQDLETSFTIELQIH
nr:GHKL domain-containing protein [Cytophagales bacterium]